MKTAEKETNAITRRVITSAQSKGSLGKSTLESLLIEWFLYAGVPFKAADCDPVHHSLANRYPRHAGRFDATANRDEFGQLLGAVPDTAVVLWDFPAQFTPEFLDYSEHFGLVEALADSRTRLTLFVFMSDDQDATDSTAAMVERLGDQVDWVLVTNPANFRSVEFRKTGLYVSWFSERKTPEIDIPHMSTVSKNAWADLEASKGRHFSIGEVMGRAELPFVVRRELSGVLDRMFVQFEDIASLLLPGPDLIKNKVNRIKVVPAKASASRFSNPLLAKAKK